MRSRISTVAIQPTASTSKRKVLLGSPYAYCLGIAAKKRGNAWWSPAAAFSVNRANREAAKSQLLKKTKTGSGPVLRSRWFAGPSYHLRANVHEGFNRRLAPCRSGGFTNHLNSEQAGYKLKGEGNGTLSLGRWYQRQRKISLSLWAKQRIKKTLVSFLTRVLNV